MKPFSRALRVSASLFQGYDFGVIEFFVNMEALPDHPPVFDEHRAYVRVRMRESDTLAGEVQRATHPFLVRWPKTVAGNDASRRAS